MNHLYLFQDRISKVENSSYQYTTYGKGYLRRELRYILGIQCESSGGRIGHDVKRSEGNVWSSLTLVEGRRSVRIDNVGRVCINKIRQYGKEE